MVTSLRSQILRIASSVLLQGLAMTSKRSESAIRLAMTNKTHPLTPSAREGEFFASLTSLKGIQMIT